VASKYFGHVTFNTAGVENGIIR